MPRLIYVGPHDAVDVLGQVVKHGKAANLPKILLDQPGNWQPVKATTTKKES